MKIESTNFQAVTPLAKGTKADSHAAETPAVKPVKSSTETANNNLNSKMSASDSYVEFAHKPKQELTMDESEWIELIEKANKAINGANKSFEYSIHEKTKQIMVKVLDKDTGETIREIPPEKVLDMVARMWEVAGLLVDERR